MRLLWLKRLVPSIYFLTIGFSSFFVFGNVTLTQIIQILAVLVLLIGLVIKFVLPRINENTKKFFYFLIFLPVVLFIYLLIFTTGGITSPFLIISHFAAIALAFLISPSASINFIISSLILVGANLKIDESARLFITQAPFAAILYLIAYIALIPISHLIAKEYRVKEQWAKILEKQIATSKSQEETMLKNITEAIIVTDLNLKIVYLNQAVGKLLGITDTGQSLFDVIGLKDTNGRDLFPYNLPFKRTIETKNPSYLEDLQVAKKGGNFLRVNINVLPIIETEGTVGLMLIVKDRQELEKSAQLHQKTAFITLTYFLDILNRQKSMILRMPKAVVAEPLKATNDQLERVSKDLFYSMRLESGELGAIYTLVDVGKLTEMVVEEEQKRLEDSGIKIETYSPVKRPEVTAPKGDEIFKVEKHVFEEIFVLGNSPWLKDSLLRLTNLFAMVCKAGQKIRIQASHEQNLSKIIIYLPQIGIDRTKAASLLEKFYGVLNQEPRLANGTGLEGYVAKSLIEMMGGNIQITSTSQGLNIAISFGQPKIQAPMA